MPADIASHLSVGLSARFPADHCPPGCARLRARAGRSALSFRPIELCFWLLVFLNPIAATPPASAQSGEETAEAKPLLERKVVLVDGDQQLRSALADLQPGTILRIAAGEYQGGHIVHGVRSLTVQAADPDRPPRFHGGRTAWQFSRCNDLRVADLRISGQSHNGINIDDGGQRDLSSRGLRLERLEISDIGPTGNHDGIKLSGISQLEIRDCRISGWGGQAIDLVGCHQGLIVGCQFTGKEGFTATAGVQTKGGSSQITIAHCVFENAGQRPLNIGGSTGLDYFRPADAPFEAHRITVRHNVISGSLCAAAFVGVDTADFVENQIYYPQRWVFRILQESRQERFVPCRNVVARNNQIVFRRREIADEFNVGESTAPQTCDFTGNDWLAIDDPTNSTPQRLPGVFRDGQPAIGD